MSCPKLFGAPNNNTGLTEAECAPAFDGFAPPTYDEAFLEALGAAELVDAPAAPAADPYAEAWTTYVAGVCAVVWASSERYRLETFADEEAAAAAGAAVTHRGGCGLCSSLADLAVYIRAPDLAEPVRACSLAHLTGTMEEHVACLREIGFTEPCAAIWYWNSKHTQAACFSLCIAALNDPSHEADGSLNACVQCDEDESGDVFKEVARRTRRSSGLPSALCRPCETVYPLVHAYPRPTVDAAAGSTSPQALALVCCLVVRRWLRA
mmetsp:Transcript_12416/g.38262  ORF Transcript_12416/g.38262 Transcript_12416/m.38262 type:complete len:266 (+) Transcript_12416:1273-2070(+)